jgi:hypothetical protein
MDDVGKRKTSPLPGLKFWNLKEGVLGVKMEAKRLSGDCRFNTPIFCNFCCTGREELPEAFQKFDGMHLQ